ncbi:MAG: hypothetical protein ACYCZF_13855 [Anaerolineae bacterium]
MAAIAPTGAGKTTLFAELLPLRQYNIFLGTKLDDPLYRRIMRQGYKRIGDISEVKPWENNLLLWPKPGKTIRDTYAIQRGVIADALDSIVKQGSWTVWIDECKYVAEQLGLSKELTFCLEQLRSINGTTINGAQRPAWLPRSVLANSTHVFLWRTNDREDAKRLSDIGGVDSRYVLSEAKLLSKHEFIYVNARTGEILKSQVKRR